MIVPTLSQEVASDLLADPTKLELVDPERDIEYEGTGDRLGHKTVSSLHNRLVTARDDAVEERPQTPDAVFEARGSSIIHEELSLDPRAASSPGFWRWLSLAAENGRFRELIEWRFGRNGEHIEEINYGMGSQAAVWEGLFARMWLRADMSFDADREDEYDLARRGDIDIWRSHIIRQDYGRSRTLVAALIEYQYPSSGKNKRTLSNKKVRTLARLLREAHATSQFVSITEEQAEEIIRRNAFLA